MRAITSFAFALSALSFVACGGDDGGTITPIDAAGGIDGAGGDAALPCTISTANFGEATLTATPTFAANMDTPALYKIAFTAPLETGDPSDIFFFEVFTGYAPFGDQTNPTPAIAGSYAMSGNQLQYEDCSVCLTLGSNAAADGSTYDDDFMVTAGNVNISEIGTAVGQNLSVTFTNLTFEQVTISSAHSTPVGNGCVTAISNASFTGVLAAPPAKPGALGPTLRIPGKRQ